ncbi:plasmid mobilization relaxosome protein MobC [Pseudoroseicyclus sp. CXY001]|uniref:plasmid mobilization relaxosome protein MobC n=1 Tax=Pseudoroseicyclus sp. CXY001 TaxID=3242492 RepID=UPI003570E600
MTVRLSPEDHAKLTELANGTALSVFLRAKALGEILPRRRASGLAIEDREAIGKLLGLLGQSRIANNLNQLAHHANIGTLPVDDTTASDLQEACHAVIAMRAILMQALGLKS